MRTLQKKIESPIQVKIREAKEVKKMQDEYRASKGARKNYNMK
jgi:hypothetical protein